MTTLRLSNQHRPLGKSGLSVSPLAWGMWRLAGDDVKGTRGLIDAALGAGITLFDTADIYGCDTAAGFGSAEALFGWAPGTLRGEDVSVLAADLTAELHRQYMHRYARTGEASTPEGLVVGRMREVEAIRRDGSRFPADVGRDGVR